MKCKYCGQESEGVVRFCPKCGARYEEIPEEPEQAEVTQEEPIQEEPEAKSPKLQKKESDVLGGFAIASAFLSMLFSVMNIANSLLNEQYDLTLAFYAGILAVLCIFILNACINNAFTRVCRGFFILLLLEGCILCNLGIFNGIIDGSYEFTNIRRLMMALWLMCLLLFLLVSGLKTLFFPKSGLYAFFEVLFAVMTTVAAAVAVISQLEYSALAHTFDNAEGFYLFLQCSAYVIFEFFVLSHLLLSWRDLTRK